MEFRKERRKRTSTFVAIIMAALMLAVPFTAFNFEFEQTEGAPKADVTYDLNGGLWTEAPSPDLTRFDIGQTGMILFDPIPTKSNHAFVGWGIKESPSGDPVLKYKVTDPYKDREFIMPMEGITVYAMWAAVTDIVTSNNAKSGFIDIIYDQVAEKYLINNVPANGSIMMFTGTFSYASSIRVLSTDPINRLYIVLNNVMINHNHAWDSYLNLRNPISIDGDSSAILQYVGENLIRTNEPDAALIRVASDGELFIQGQDVSELRIMRESAHANSGGAGIGGNGGGRGSGANTEGGSGERIGFVQIESGNLFIGLIGTGAIHSPGIGSGGSFGTSIGAEGGSITIHGGYLGIFIFSDIVLAAGIGGSGIQGSNKAGSGGTISITGGDLRIKSSGTHILAAGIGGGSAYNGGFSGDSGAIDISGGSIAIDQTSETLQDSSPPRQNNASGIGSGGGLLASAGSAAPTADNPKNGIVISGDRTDISIKQTGIEGTMSGAGIGAGGSKEGNGNDANVSIDGGQIYIGMVSGGDMSGAGIGAGGSQSKTGLPGKADIQISRGNVSILMMCLGQTLNAPGIGGSSNGSNSIGIGNVTVNGGTITVEKDGNAASEYVDIGDGGALYDRSVGSTPVIVTGGSIYTDGREMRNARQDPNGAGLPMTAVRLNEQSEPESDVLSVFVKHEGQDKRYVDYGIQSKHKASFEPYNDMVYLYLPATDGSYSEADTSLGNKISVETSERGFTRFYTSEGDASPMVATRGTDHDIPTGTVSTYPTYYRVSYMFDDGLEYEYDVVHYSDASAPGSLFAQRVHTKGQGLSVPLAVDAGMIDAGVAGDVSWTYNPYHPGYGAFDCSYEVNLIGGSIGNPLNSERVGEFAMNQALTGKLELRGSPILGIAVTYVDDRHGIVSGHEGNAPYASTVSLGATIILNVPSEWSQKVGSYAIAGWKGSDGKLYDVGDEYEAHGPMAFVAIWDHTGIQIVNGPANQHVGKGLDATFEVIAIHSESEPLKYRWEHFSKNSEWVTVTKGQGASTSALTISAYDMYEEGDLFRCVVYTDGGETTVTDGAVLSVDSNIHYVSTIYDLMKVGTGKDGWNPDHLYIQSSDIDFDGAGSHDMLDTTRGWMVRITYSVNANDDVTFTLDHKEGNNGTWSPWGSQEISFSFGNHSNKVTTITTEADGSFTADSDDFRYDGRSPMVLMVYGTNAAYGSQFLSSIEVDGGSGIWDGYHLGDMAPLYITGEYDGNGYSILNLDIAAYESASGIGVGLFSHATAGTYANISRVAGSTIGITDEDRSGGNKDQGVGGIIGLVNVLEMDGVSVYNCYNSGAVASLWSAGGIIGRMIGTNSMTISECINEGTVGSLYLSGGIMGYHRFGELHLKDCSNSGTIYGVETSGGILGGINGRVPGMVLRASITDCSNSGDIINVTYDRNSRAGGMLGWGSADTIIDSCSNSGTVKAIGNRWFAYAGGIVGVMYGTVYDCSSSGQVIAEGYDAGVRAGGIVGLLSSGVVSGCDAKDVTVKGSIRRDMAVSGISSGIDIRAGGIVGDAVNSSIEGCTSNSSVNGKAIVVGATNVNGPGPSIVIGGVAGMTDARSIVSGCKFNGGSTYDGSQGCTPEVYVGGIVGRANGNVMGCETDASLSCGESNASFYAMGGIAGITNAKVIDCVSQGTLFAYGRTVSIGGIVGEGNASSSISGCMNGSIVNGGSSSSNYVAAGGIAGIGRGASDGNENHNVVSATGNFSRAGGISGIDRGTIANATNYSDVNATGDDSRAGGVAGVSYGSSIMASYSKAKDGTSPQIAATSGSSTGFASAGGILGYYVDVGGTIGSCINQAIVTATNPNGQAYAGGVTGFISKGTVTSSVNAVESKVLAVGKTSRAGGIAGFANNSNVEGENHAVLVKAMSDASNGAPSAGGIVGVTSGTTIVSNSNNGHAHSTIGVVEAVASGANGNAKAGGIVGYAPAGTSIASCDSHLSVRAIGTEYAYAGGIVGISLGSIRDCSTSIPSIEGVSAIGKNARVGGIAGHTSDATVSNVSVSDTHLRVSGGKGIADIVGFSYVSTISGASSSNVIHHKG